MDCTNVSTGHLTIEPFIIMISSQLVQSQTAIHVVRRCLGNKSDLVNLFTLLIDGYFEYIVTTRSVR